MQTASAAKPMHSQRYAAKDDAPCFHTSEAGHSEIEHTPVAHCPCGCSLCLCCGRCSQKRVNAPLSEEELKIELKIYYGQRGARV